MYYSIFSIFFTLLFIFVYAKDMAIGLNSSNQASLKSISPSENSAQPGKVDDLKPIAKDVKEILEKMPFEDKEQLTRLFYWMLNDHHLGYTLFADKPVSTVSEFTTTPLHMSHKVCGGVYWNFGKNISNISQLIIIFL
jgi:hypothetical protein